jgi:peptidyl-prolyl cis-trans isomerase D
MLQTIHDKLKGIFAVVILAALGIVFVFWGVDVSVGSFTKARGIEVNGRDIAVDEVQRAYNDELSRYQAALGGEGVPDAMREALRDRVLDQAIRAELIRQRTRELDYEATSGEVLAAIHEVPAFQVEGKFSPDAYHAALRSINISPERFEAEQRELVLARQLDRGLYSSAFVLPSEFERDVALRHETRTVGWIRLPAAEFEREVSLEDAAIKAWYEANKNRFMTEEVARVDYIELDIDELAANAAVDEQGLRQYYEEIKGRYTTPGRRHARHILIEPGDDPKAGEAEAKRVYERAKAGEDFAALARELSDDAGSREAGGDLGFAERGDFDPAFADALWSMKPGEIRGPVKSAFGWHVIRLEAVEPETVRSFEQVRAELEPEYRKSQVEQAFGDAQEELDTVAFESGGNIASVAQKAGRPLQHVERFTRAGGGALGAAREVVDAVFAPDVLAGREVRVVELEPGHVVAVAVSRHEPQRQRPLEDVRAEVEKGARREAAAKLAAARAAELVSKLASGAAWSTVAGQGQGGAGQREPRQVSRSDADVPAEIRDAAFGAPAPAGKPRYGAVALEGGDSAVWTVTVMKRGQPTALTAEERKQEQERSRERIAMTDSTAYVTEMRADADVDVNPQLFE